MSGILWKEVLYNSIIFLSPLYYYILGVGWKFEECLYLYDVNKVLSSWGLAWVLIGGFFLKLKHTHFACILDKYRSIMHKIDLSCFSVRAKAAGFFLEMWFRWHQSLWIHCPDYVKVGLHS